MPGLLRRTGREDGGESGIRTHEAVLAPTRFPIVLLQPLGHLSAMGYPIATHDCNHFCARQQARGSGLMYGANRGPTYPDNRPHGKPSSISRGLPDAPTVVAWKTHGDTMGSRPRWPRAHVLRPRRRSGWAVHATP